MDSNSALQFFRECCKLEEGSSKARSEVFDTYKNFCQDNCLRPMSQTSFNKDIERAYPQIARGLDPVSKRRIWKGIAFQPGVEF